MKTNFKLFGLLIFAVLFSSICIAQNEYKYKTYPNDPFNIREYTLDNGLKVFFSVYKDAPRVDAQIIVKVGSKNDPKETTGLAHYFEHMMFKGSQNAGTLNWEKEKVLIQKIEDLFEAYRIVSDEETRKAIYKTIDSLSFEASKLAIPNEYDNLMKSIGSIGTNAGTSFDYTTYLENIPSNELENWAKIQADRFKSPVLRLFHTELETVYEEKNMTLMQDSRKSNDAMFKALFPNHPYGQQTTIGEAEHLKNPSMRNIREFFNQYYVPNNMAICLSGDFDPDEAIALIDKYFKDLKPRELPEFKYEKEKPLTEPVKIEVKGLEAEKVTIAFPINAGAGSKEDLMLNMISTILSNGKCGLIDINLNKKQAVLGAGSGDLVLNDYSALLLVATPKMGQSLDEAANLLLEQVDLLKKGQFENWILEASINNQKLAIMKECESNKSRARKMAMAFSAGKSWDKIIAEQDMLSKITKKEIIDFANNYFKNGYVVVYKRKAQPDEIEKVTKPEITPIHINRGVESDFTKDIKSSIVSDIQPVFVDYQKDMQRTKTKNGIEILYTQNTENKTFELSYLFTIGSGNNKKLSIASEYLNYLNTSKHSAEQIQEEFYKMACNTGFSSAKNETHVKLSGLSENMIPAITLLEELFSDPQHNEEALKNLIADILKSRQDDKVSQKEISNTLRSYAMYGDNSPRKDILSTEELNNITSQELINIIKDLFSYQHRVLYYGPESIDNLKSIIEENHKTPTALKKTPKEKEYEALPTNENKLYFLDYNIKQAQLLELMRGGKYDKKLTPSVNLYNEYFSGGMNSIVFQELREKRSLAYTAQAVYLNPNNPNNHYINLAFIGTQSDKIIDAFDGFNDLFNNMPLSENNFNMSKESILSSIRTTRITKMRIIESFLKDEKMGFNYDSRKDLFNEIPKMKMQDVEAFNAKYIKNKPKIYVILGNEKDMNFDALKKYGKLHTLSLETIFGY